ncbi:MAG TPA: hypothetical protein VMW21_01985 [Patescibacteria group bacterium]|nr:hypothetical protein [Patescibacteria group bacterium]
MEIVNFYNNLFTIEIAVFGIIAAAIFVFLQIIYSQFSYREISVIFKNTYLILYFLLSTLTLILTAAGSLLLSFPSYKFITTNVDFVIRELFENGPLSMRLLALFFVSLILFGLSTFTNFEYIRPSKIALLIGKKMKVVQIRNFLLKKYGVPVPDKWTLNIGIYLPVRIGEKEQEVTPKETKEKNKEAEKQLAVYQAEYERIRQEVKNSQNTFEPLDALILKAIGSVDLRAIDEAFSVLVDVSSRFIEAYPITKKDEAWSPDSGVIEKYLKNITENLYIYVDMCDRQKLETVKIKILDASKEIADKIIIRNYQWEIKVIFDFWKKIGDSAITKSPIIFNKVIQLYRDVGDYAFKNGIDANEKWLEDVFRGLGWLGERLLTKQGIEEKPIIYDDSYFNEYDQLLNAIFSFEYEYNYKYPGSYPLIYFDVIHVIFLQLITSYKKTKIYDVKNHIFSCIYIYSSFAKVAIEKENSNGAALAAMNLKDSYDELIKNGLEESAKEALKLLIDVGGEAAGHKDNLKKVEFIPKLLDEYIIDIVESSSFREDISGEINEIYIRAGGNHDRVLIFIKALGKRMRTNFGFMFDWETGETYAKDDPRRY